MKTKQLILGLFAFMATLLTSCTDKETVAGTEANGTKTVTFNVTTDAQAQTRTAPTVSGYKLNYVLQVLDADGNPVTEAEQNNQTGTFTVSLPVGTTYTCLFWADFIPDAGSSAADNEYFTTTDLKAVALKQALTGDDQCQAFCGTASVAVDQAAATTSITLKRAVAQVNLMSKAEMKDYSKLEAKYTNVPNTFNVLDNTTSVSGTTGIAPNFTVTDLSVATGDNNFTFQSAYFLAPGTEAANMVQIELKTYNSTAPSTPIETLTIANVPTKKNYKTNVKGAFKPANVEHTYTIDFGEWGTDIAHRIPSVWNGTYPSANADAAFSGGTGTQSDPYIIGEAADLAQLAVNVNAGTNYDSKYFELTTDIDLNNKEWTPIGNDANKPFKGNFDGNKYKINNLSVNTDAMYAGLFGIINKNAIISLSNLHVSGSVTNTNTSQYSTTGGIVGYFKTDDYPNTGAISNCSFTGSVTHNNGYAGGICGTASSSNLSCCANYGTVTGNVAGGITGWMQLETKACYNKGTITGKSNAGGIAGRWTDASAILKNCYNTGTIQAVAGSEGSAGLGAIAGNMDGVTFTDCYGVAKYAVVNDNEKVFGDTPNWPTWKAGDTADGTDESGYWKSIGSWNGGTPEYPKLWWEE